MLVFKGRRKPEFLEKNRSEKRKPTTNSTNILGFFLKKELQGKKEGITGINYTTNVPNADMTTVQTTPPQYKEAW